MVKITNQPYTHVSFHEQYGIWWRQIEDLVETVDRELKARDIDSLEDVRTQTEPIAGFSPTLAVELDELRLFLRDRLYRHSRVVAMADRGKNIVRKVFEHFIETPESMPENFTLRL